LIELQVEKILCHPSLTNMVATNIRLFNMEMELSLSFSLFMTWLRMHHISTK